jgi:aspartyl-tRNA(Asn)/glutamyl-tRNA(Gln) amidotransferase subunit A
MELCDLTIHEALRGLKEKKFSSQELTLSCLQRIDKVEDKLNAFITVTPELALEQADAVDKKISRGEKIPSLAGIPMAFKDLFCTKGIETTAASNILRGFVPPYDATVVRKLKDAGVVILGKTNHDAFAHGSSGENSDFGSTKNPWDLSRVPGGSSSGSGTAVAAGECLFATGTDTGSSIRLPAAFCNLVGLKPTYGRVSRYGVIAMASSLDTVGCLTKDITDHALVMKAIAGHDPLDATTPDIPVPNYTQSLSSNIKGVKIGIPSEYFEEGVQAPVKQLVEKATRQFEDLGASIKQVSLPHTQYGLAVYCITCHSEVSSNLARYDGMRFGRADQKGKDIRDVYFKSRGGGFGMEAKRRIVMGTFSLSSGYYEDYYEKAQKVRTLIKRDFESAFKKVDILIAPSSPTVPFKIGEKPEPLEMYLSDILLCPVNLAGIPSLNVPCGFVDNLPVGLQIIGPAFSEDLLFRIGYNFEQVVKHHRRRPVLS